MSQTRRYTVELLTEQLLTIQVDATSPALAEGIARWIQATQDFSHVREGEITVISAHVTEQEGQ